MDRVKRQHACGPLFLAVLFSIIDISLQQPSLTTASVYEYAPFFIVQPSNATSSSGVMLTPYGSYTFAYPFLSQTQVNTMMLPCVASGTPAPTYQWKINNSIVSSSAQYNYNSNGPGNLTISPLSPGTYQCIVLSGSSTAMSDIVNLTATFMDITDTTSTSAVITLNQGDYYVMPQNAVTYKSFPQPSVVWQRDNGLSSNPFYFDQLKFDSRVIQDELGRVHITFAQQSDCCNSNWQADKNYYRLRYQLPLMDRQRTPYVAQLTVASSPSSVFRSIQFRYSTPSPVVAFAGSDIRVVCVYSGSPPIVVSYFKLVNGSTIPIDTSATPNVLVLQNANLTDSGTYQCQAQQTSAPTGTGVMPPITIAVTVQSPPQWINKTSDVFVPIGGQVTLPCVATGNPAVSSQWFVNGVPAQNDASSQMNATSYTLFGAQKPQSNRAVQCQVQNAFATYIANAAITVITPTQVVTAPANQLQIQPNAVVNFTCEMAGDPLLYTNISWWWTDVNGNQHSLVSSPPGVIITVVKTGSNSQQTLTVDTSQFTDQNMVRGKYTCVGSNGWSATNATGRLSFYGDADGLVTASFDLWIIGVIVGVLILIAIIVLIVVCCLRNRGGTYGVDEKERAQGNNPTEDLKRMHGFTEYVRPDSQPPAEGSRTGTLQASHAAAQGTAPPPPDYPVPPEPESDIGEDGSFRGAYGPGTASPPQPTASHYAASNAAYQPPAYDMANQRQQQPLPPPPRSKPPARVPPTPQADYYQPPQRGYYDNNAVNDSMV